MFKFAAAAVSLLLLAASLRGAEPCSSFDEALRQAKEGGKLVFVEFGRANCKNCEELKGMIRSGQVALPPSKFVLAFLDCDVKENSKLIDERFKIGAHKLPFAVVTDAEGSLLGVKTGFSTAKGYMEFVSEAERAAALRASEKKPEGNAR